LVCLHSPYPAIGPRARSARLSSRRTLAWRISALGSAMLVFRPLLLLLATCARFHTLLRAVALPREERSGMHLIATVVLLRSSDRFIAEPANTMRLSNVLWTHSCRGNKKWKWFYRLTAGGYPSPGLCDLGLSPHFGKLIEQVENPQRLPELIRFDTTLVERRTTSVLTSGYQAVYNEF
jgi:hypothetical protein